MYVREEGHARLEGGDEGRSMPLDSGHGSLVADLPGPELARNNLFVDLLDARGSATIRVVLCEPLSTWKEIAYSAQNAYFYS